MRILTTTWMIQISSPIHRIGKRNETLAACRGRFNMSLASDTSLTSSVLIVEDDVALANLIHEYLTKNDFRVDVVHDGLVAVDRILAERFDCVILDLNLPGLDGMDVCQRVRHQFSGAILMLTARGSEGEEVVGLENGADDYLTKPLQPVRLVARIRALLRRTKSVEVNRHIKIGQLLINTLNRTVTLDDRDVRLTTSEFDLLCLLATRAGETVARSELHEQLRGIPYDGLDRSIDLTIARIRKKLRDPARQAKFIQSVHATGYRLMVDQ